MYACKVICDSVTTYGERLTTLELTLPRIVLAELNTHRILSKSSASSRAIPVAKQVKRLQEDPFVPVYWGKNEKGMQANEELDSEAIAEAERIWSLARQSSIASSLGLAEVGVHKQITNRLLEPFMWHTVVLTGTDWSNFFHLRVDKDAQPEFRWAAKMVLEAREASAPRSLGSWEWHLPYMRDEDFVDQPADEVSPVNWRLTKTELAMVSVGRSARVSYLTQDGRRAVREDIALARDRLLASGHMAPWEHAARPMSEYERRLFARMELVPVGEIGHVTRWEETGKETFFLGNVNGWVQARKLIPGESDIKGFRAS